MMYHGLTPEWPCLSFDILTDTLGGGRTRYPVTMYAVCGTQASSSSKNKLTVMKLSDMHKTYKKNPDHDSDSDEEEEGEEEEEEEEEGLDIDPLLEQCSIDHRGGYVLFFTHLPTHPSLLLPTHPPTSLPNKNSVNRVRAMPSSSSSSSSSSIVATWADTAHVHLWDVSTLIKAVDNPSTATNGPSSHPPTHPPIYDPQHLIRTASFSSPQPTHPPTLKQRQSSASPSSPSTDTGTKAGRWIGRVFRQDGSRQEIMLVIFMCGR